MSVNSLTNKKFWCTNNIWDYIIPYIIGTSKFFIGQAVYTHQGVAGNIPLAAAFSIIQIIVMGIYITIAKKLGAFDAI